MLISILDYAKMHNKSDITVRKKAKNNGFHTARKIGKVWLIDSEEPYTDNRRKKEPDSTQENASH